MRKFSTSEQHLLISFGRCPIEIVQWLHRLLRGEQEKKIRSQGASLNGKSRTLLELSVRNPEKEITITSKGSIESATSE